ncbi:hypothetical protein HK107_07090 [Parvularcula sp. ZS-1/3]|uniref:Uncharacterized protein n=1 Tax=Parvularcula mediterranea TaxID=2732508 RepID=A0A7Y3RLA2_9PROT|nr:hypothetical protein [Parvularcula mediterranea]NNU16084.1 hypothetical protein [Parvularcula mediterranea]
MDKASFRHVRLNIDEAANEEQLRKQLGRTGLENGPRTGENRRTSQSSEAYWMRRWLLSQVAMESLRFPVTVLHQDAPDFEVTESNSVYGLEFTEAAPAVDGKRRAASEVDRRPRFLYQDVGDSGGAGITQGSKDLAVRQIQDAIRRKARKDYSAYTDIDLLIYPNSDAIMAAGLFGWIEDCKTFPYDRCGFRRVFLCWSDEEIQLLQ